MEKTGVKKRCRALIIGGSAGSLEVLLKVFPNINVTIPFPIIIVVHRKHGADSLLPVLLSTRTNLKVKEVDEKEKIMPGIVYIAPSDYHLLVEQDETFSLDYSEKINYSRPAIDATFQTAAEVYKTNLVCMLLSGSNSDGVNGLKSVKAWGGTTIIQDLQSAQVAYMPEQAKIHVKIDWELPIEDMAEFINLMA